MSAHYRLYCELCEVAGPQVRHSGQGVTLFPNAPYETHDQIAPLAQQEWDAFLNEHEWHGLRLLHEGDAKSDI